MKILKDHTMFFPFAVVYNLSDACVCLFVCTVEKQDNNRNDLSDPLVLILLPILVIIGFLAILSILSKFLQQGL